MTCLDVPLQLFFFAGTDCLYDQAARSCFSSLDAGPGNGCVIKKTGGGGGQEGKEKCRGNRERRAVLDMRHLHVASQVFHIRLTPISHIRLTPMSRAFRL